MAHRVTVKPGVVRAVLNGSPGLAVGVIVFQHSCRATTAFSTQAPPIDADEDLDHQDKTVKVSWLDTDTGKTDELQCTAR